MARDLAVLEQTLRNWVKKYRETHRSGEEEL
ncbi:hypothetical protein [Amycolatopsis sacchari]